VLICVILLLQWGRRLPSKEHCNQCCWLPFREHNNSIGSHAMVLGHVQVTCSSRAIQPRCLFADKRDLLFWSQKMPSLWFSQPQLFLPFPSGFNECYPSWANALPSLVANRTFRRPWPIEISSSNYLISKLKRNGDLETNVYLTHPSLALPVRTRTSIYDQTEAQ